MRKLLSPRVLVPLILSAGIIAGLLAFTDIKTVLRLMEGFNHLYLLYFLLLMIAYELIRGIQWHYLLTALKIRAPLKSQWFAFLVGETAKSLPIGNYVQNYLLERSQGADFGRSSAASTLIILTEVAISLLGVVILGLGPWTPYLRIVILSGIALSAIFVAIILKRHNPHAPPHWLTQHKSLTKALDEFHRFEEGARDLFHPRVLLVEALLSATYLLCAGAGLWLIIEGIGLGHVTFGEALSAYFFSLAVSLIVPIPIDIGVLEVSGVGALLLVGVSREGAVSAMLINRVLSMGSALVIGLAAMLVWHDELRAALRDRPRKQSGPDAKPDATDADSASEDGTNHPQTSHPRQHATP